MKSLRYLYKIGRGPSSSHTMGPVLACQVFLKRYPDASSYKIILYGSLALTGKGHLTDKMMLEEMKPHECSIEFDYLTPCEYHPNTLDIIANYQDHSESLRFYSIGGGSIEIEGEGKYQEEDVYPHNSFKEIKEYLEYNKISLIDYVHEFEGYAIDEYLIKVYNQMENTILTGLGKDGYLPGDLHILRKAKEIIGSAVGDPSLDFNRKIFAFAFAASEENASGGVVVTAPTCGASGLLPAVLFGAKTEHDFSVFKMAKALMVAGIFGNLVKENASISGAEAGCQAEIGVACSMAAAAYAYLLGAKIDQIESAAEIALEHHLGLTCDPILGYVQIPCIERNAVCAIRAINSANLVVFIPPNENKISFDMIVKTMLQTGKDLKETYRETSLGGLAKEYKG